MLKRQQQIEYVRTDLKFEAKPKWLQSHSDHRLIALPS